ncbi:MAG TPA: GFA family protein [Reyranella sp.]
MTARCCCGACSIEVEGAPLLNAICHCDNCKRRTGSAFGWSTYFADEQVANRSGELRCYEIGDSRQRRWFCAACGTTLYWKIDRRPGETGIAGGCFVDPLPAPTRSVVNEGRPAWLCTIVQDGMRQPS